MRFSLTALVSWFRRQPALTPIQAVEQHTRQIANETPEIMESLARAALGADVKARPIRLHLISTALTPEGKRQ